MTRNGAGGHAPRRIVILLGAKLIGLDAILPVAMALKKEAPGAEITFLHLDRRGMAVVARNYVLAEGIRRTGRAAYLSSGRGGLVAKAMAGTRLIGWWLRLRLGRSWLFCYSDAAAFPVAAMARAARAGGGRVLLYAKPAVPGSLALTAVHRAREAAKGKADQSMRDAGDAFVIYHPDQAGDVRVYTDAAPIVIGTPRTYPEWTAHLAAIRAETGITDASGRAIPVEDGRPVIAAFYSGDVVIPTQIEPPRQRFLRFLAVAAAAVPEALVLIKPHPNCDLAQLDADLAAIGHDGFVVTHAHPQLLAQVARAAVFNNGSYAMNDVYQMGCPILELSDYTAEVTAIAPSLFDNRGRVDCSDEDTWAPALRRMVEALDSLPVPDLSTLHHPKPSDLLAHLSGHG